MVNKANILLMGAHLIFSRSNSSISYPCLIFFSDFFKSCIILQLCSSHLFPTYFHIPAMLCLYKKPNLYFSSVKYQETLLCTLLILCIFNLLHFVSSAPKIDHFAIQPLRFLFQHMCVNLLPPTSTINIHS